MTNLKVYKNGEEVVEVNKNLYEILVKLPSPNSKFNLSKEQKYWYDFFGNQLVETKKLTKPDLIHLHQLATSVDYYVQAETKIREKGFDGGIVQTFKGGATNVSGYMTIREKMIKEINELSKHFGFSFRDRIKLVEKKESDPNQTNLFEQFMNAKNG